MSYPIRMLCKLIINNERIIYNRIAILLSLSSSTFADIKKCVGLCTVFLITRYSWIVGVNRMVGAMCCTNGISADIKIFLNLSFRVEVCWIL
jgi:hypothetical protein